MRTTFVFLSAAIVSIASIAPQAWAFDPGGARPDLALMAATPQWARLSPDGRWLAFSINWGAGSSRWQVCETDGNRRREVVGASGGQGAQSELAFSGDSKCVIYPTVTPEGFDYVVRDLQTWTTKRSFRCVSTFTATPNARHLVIKGPPGMTDSSASKRPPGPGEVLVYSLIEDRITVIGPAALHEISGDGQLVAFVKAGPDGRTSLDVLRLGETEARRIYEVRGEVTAMAWGDDHRSLALVIAQDKADGETADLMVAIDDATAKTPRILSILPEGQADWLRGGVLDPSLLRVGDAAAIVYFVIRDEAVARPRRRELVAHERRDDDLEIHRATDHIVYDALTDRLQERSPTASGLVYFAWIPAEGRIVKVARGNKVASGNRDAVVLLRGGRAALVSRGEVVALFPTSRPRYGTSSTRGAEPVRPWQRNPFWASRR